MMSPDTPQNTADESARRYGEFLQLYLPDLVNYVVAILVPHEYPSSGVLVNYRGRHIVASARHCIENKPRLFLPTSRIERNKDVIGRQVRIVRTILHDRLDIGFLEIDDPGVGGLTESHLCTDRIIDGEVHIIGYPAVMTDVDRAKNNFISSVGAFGTTLLEDADDFLKFDYPKRGHNLDPATGEWVSTPFPKSPKGFSGGGCFGIAKRTAGVVQAIEYKLFGIQSAWHPEERWVKVVPIKHLCDLLGG